MIINISGSDFLNENNILFTYDCVSRSLALNWASNQLVPVFSPDEITGILSGFVDSETPVASFVQVKLSDRKSYRMGIISKEPKKYLNVVLTETDN